MFLCSLGLRGHQHCTCCQAAKQPVTQPCHLLCAVQAVCFCRRSRCGPLAQVDHSQARALQLLAGRQAGRQAPRAGPLEGGSARCTSAGGTMRCTATAAAQQRGNRAASAAAPGAAAPDRPHQTQMAARPPAGRPHLVPRPHGALYRDHHPAVCAQCIPHLLRCTRRRRRRRSLRTVQGHCKPGQGRQHGKAKGSKGQGRQHGTDRSSSMPLPALTLHVWPTEPPSVPQHCPLGSPGTLLASVALPSAASTRFMRARARWNTM
jgi:hypothetical protein